MAKLFPDRDEANGVEIKKRVKEYWGSPNSLDCKVEKGQKDLNKKGWCTHLLKVLFKF